MWFSMKRELYQNFFLEKIIIILYTNICVSILFSVQFGNDVESLKLIAGIVLIQICSGKCNREILIVPSMK